MADPYTRPAQVLDALDRGPLPEDVPRIRGWVLAARGAEDLTTTLDGITKSREALVKELAEGREATAKKDAEARPILESAVASLKVLADAELIRAKTEADETAGRNLWRHPDTIKAVGTVIIAALSLLAGTQLPSMTSDPSPPPIAAPTSVGTSPGAP